MDTHYDFIILGTGLKECVLSGLLSVAGKKVLHMDRNNYYGGDCASLNLDQLFQKFCPADQKVPDSFGRTRDYNIDLCPKFIMACGNLVKMLLHTKVTRYLEFKSVAGSFVAQTQKIHKVPATTAEALSSGLMGILEKRRFKNFVQFVNDYDFNKQATWQGLDVTKVTSRDVFKHFGLAPETITFTGHAFALYLDDGYIDKPAKDMIERVKLYAYSVSRYGNSPYIYPVYGTGGLPEGFSRLAAVFGGVYMLNKPIEEILYNDDGTIKGVKSQGEVATCDRLIADPSYFLNTDKIKKVGQVAHSICILSHPIDSTKDVDSCQIIIPSSEIQERKSDIYVSCVSWQHNVAAKGKYIAHVSCQVETAKPHDELIPGLRLLGKIDKEFFYVNDTYAPSSNGNKDRVYISHSFDGTSHYETATDDIMQMYEAITGSAPDLSAPPEKLGADQD
jgi:Rab GDP dissociation inhibitor